MRWAKEVPPISFLPSFPSQGRPESLRNSRLGGRAKVQKYRFGSSNDACRCRPRNCSNVTMLFLLYSSKCPIVVIFSFHSVARRAPSSLSVARASAAAAAAAASSSVAARRSKRKGEGVRRVFFFRYLCGEIKDRLHVFARKYLSEIRLFFCKQKKDEGRDP